MRSIWDFWARHYDSLWVQRVSLRPTRQALIRNIEVRSGHSILDMGCGTGQLLGDLKNHFGEKEFIYAGVDQSEDMIAVARKKYPHNDFYIASSAAYQSSGRLYDVVICSHSFPYFPNKVFMFRKLRAFLKEGGSLMIAQAAMDNIYDRFILSLVKLTTSQAHYYSRSRMRELAKPVFRSLPEETRISDRIFMPSIYLYKWIWNG